MCWPLSWSEGENQSIYLLLSDFLQCNILHGNMLIAHLIILMKFTNLFRWLLAIVIENTVFLFIWSAVLFPINCNNFSSMLYLKFVMVWASIVLADYMLEFRFEFLWPFWMMLRSVYDSYKYQGLVSWSFHYNNIDRYF